MMQNRMRFQGTVAFIRRRQRQQRLLFTTIKDVLASSLTFNSVCVLFWQKSKWGNAGHGNSPETSWGTLKVKRYIELRSPERSHSVPVLKFASLYFIWWSNRAKLQHR